VADIIDSPQLESARDSELEAILSTSLKSLSLELSQKQKTLLLDYLALFVKWNKTYNLSAIRDPIEMLRKHLIDSLAIAEHIKEDSGTRYLDVGTGGGLPGIPLAICFPERKFELLDSAGKKIRFLFQVKQSLKLDNVELHNLRVESLKDEAGFDGIVSRAFASIEDFTQLTKHLISAKGKFWAMKGVFPKDELSAVEKHYIVLAHHQLQVPGLDAERCLLVLGAK
jgi:16S rRNA (guanine527-N7)-methyltransferase